MLAWAGASGDAGAPGASFSMSAEVVTANAALDGTGKHKSRWNETGGGDGNGL